MAATAFIGERVVRPWRETTLLATGASSGIGRETVADLLGATDIRKVLIGTRSIGNFDTTVAWLGARIPNLDQRRVEPFIADFSHPGETTAQYKAVHDQGDRVTDIAYFAAGGMEGVLNKVGLRLRRLVRVDRADPAYQQELDSINEVIAEGVEEKRSYARAVNFEGPAALHRFVSADGGRLPLPEDSMQIDQTSLWATFLKNVPRFYRDLIAEPKHEFEEELQTAGEWFDLERDRYYFGKVSGGIVLDTLVGKGINNFILPLLSEQDQAAVREYAITMKDMSLANRMMLESDPRTWEDNFKTLYVYGEGGQVQINDTLTSEHPMFNIKMPI